MHSTVVLSRICHLSSSCPVLKSFNRFRCHLLGTLVHSRTHLCWMQVPHPQQKPKFWGLNPQPKLANFAYLWFTRGQHWWTVSKVFTELFWFRFLVTIIKQHWWKRQWCDYCDRYYHSMVCPSFVCLDCLSHSCIKLNRLMEWDTVWTELRTLEAGFSIFDMFNL